MYVRILGPDGSVAGRVKASDVYAYFQLRDSDSDDGKSPYVRIYLAYSKIPTRSYEPIEKFEYALFNAMGDNG
jgi:hypothetical protein